MWPKFLPETRVKCATHPRQILRLKKLLEQFVHQPLPLETPWHPVAKPNAVKSTFRGCNASCKNVCWSFRVNTM